MLGHPIPPCVPPPQLNGKTNDKSGFSFINMGTFLKGLTGLIRSANTCIFYSRQKFATVKSTEMNHFETDQVSLELARRIAKKLRSQPEVIDFARANLSRWFRQNASAPSLLRCYAEWQRILSRPVEDICALLCSSSDEAQRLRQNSPFAGVLTPIEVWEVKSRFRHAPATA